MVEGDRSPTLDDPGLDPGVQRARARRADLRPHGWQPFPFFSAIGEFVSGLIASATDAAAHPYSKPKEAEPPTAVPFVVEAADAPREDGAAVSEQAPSPAPVEVGNEQRPEQAPSCVEKRSWTRWTARMLRTRIDEVFGQRNASLLASLRLDL